MNIKEKLLPLWQNLQARERIYVVVGGIFLIFILLYSFIVSPWTNHKQDLRNELQENLQTLHYLSSAASQIEQLKLSDTQSISDEPLLLEISNSLRQNHLDHFAAQTTQTDQNITVTFSGVPFDLLSAWLMKIWQEQLIEVKELNLIPLPTAGLVNTTITFARA